MKPLLLILLFTTVCEARTLLVPSPFVEFEHYDSSCRRNNHSCSFDYLTGLLEAKPTPNFDYLLDKLDLNDRRSMDNFRNRLIHILNTEEISALQLEMLLTVLFEMNRVQPTVYFQMIEGELRRLQALLNTSDVTSSAKFAYIFKKRFPLAKIAKLRTDILKIPIYILHYSSLPLKSNTREMRWPPKRPLLQGDCESERLTRPLERTAWKVLSACNASPKATADSESKPAEFRGGRHIL